MYGEDRSVRSLFFSDSFYPQYQENGPHILGYVACPVTSKILGIGAAERVWGDTKTIKASKRKHLTKASQWRNVGYSILWQK